MSPKIAPILLRKLVWKTDLNRSDRFENGVWYPLPVAFSAFQFAVFVIDDSCFDMNYALPPSMLF
jgi:hypothetical protein